MRWRRGSLGRKFICKSSARRNRSMWRRLSRSDRDSMKNGIIIVDHGSRREESNQMLEEVADLFAQRFVELYEVVEPAHMEIAEPSIATAYAKCVERGATRIIV